MHNRRLETVATGKDKMTTIDFTDEEINILKNLLESKDKELYSINKSFHTVWFQSESSEAELRIAFLSNVQLTISRVCVSHKRQEIMTTVLKELIRICKRKNVHKIVMQSVLTPECAAFCEKNNFIPNPSTSFKLGEIICGDWVLNI